MIQRGESTRRGIAPLPAPYAYRLAERFNIPMEYIYRGRSEYITDQELRLRILNADISE